MAALREVSRPVVRSPALGLGVLTRSVGVVAFATIVVASIATIQLAELALPLSTDQALYSFIGQAVRHGAVPYRDFADLKPPGIFYLRAALGAVPGAEAWTSQCVLHASCAWLEVKVWDVVTTAALAVLIFALARALGFDHRAAVVAAGLGALYTSLSVISQLGLTPEKLAALCTAGGVLAAARGRAWLAGAAVGVGVLMKQPAGLELVPVLILTSRARWRAAIGFAIPLASVGAVLALQGALPQAIDYALGVNVERIGTPSSLGGFGGDTSLQSAWQAARNGLAPFWLLGTVGLLALGAPGLTRRARVTLLAWAAVDVLSLARLREYLQLAPSLALLGAWGTTRLIDAAERPPHLGIGGRWAARAALVLGIGTVALLSSGYQESIVMRAINERGVRGFVRSPDELVADELGRLQAGRLYVWGNGTELYLLSGRAPASSSLNVVALSTNLPAAGVRRQRLMDELGRQPPAVVAISPEAVRQGDGLELRDFPALDELLRTSYTEDAVLADQRFGGWRLFVRAGAQAMGQPEAVRAPSTD